MYQSVLTIVIDVLIPVKALAAIVQVRFIQINWPEYTLLAQVAHEELETN